MTRREQAVLLFVGIAMVAGAFSMYWYRAQDTSVGGSAPEERAVESLTVPLPVSVEPDPPAPEAVAPVAANPAKAELAVSVMGAVRKPGLYRLGGDPRIQDAIDEAGGLLEEADVADINLAAKIIDGTTLSIPRRMDAEATLSGQSSAGAINPPEYTIGGWQRGVESAATNVATSGQDPTVGTPARINLRTATQEQLETLPGIGPKLAASILQFRGEHGFAAIEDLKNVSGIGDKRFEAIQPFVVIE